MSALVIFLVATLICGIAPSAVRVAYQGTLDKVEAAVEEVLSTLHLKKVGQNGRTAPAKQPGKAINGTAEIHS